MLYGHFLTITNLHQRLHTPRTSTSALPRHYQTRTFLTAAENTPSPPLSCSPLSRTAHHPSAALCNRMALAHADQAHAQHTHATAYAHSDTASHPSKPRARTMRSGDAS